MAFYAPQIPSTKLCGTHQLTQIIVLANAYMEIATVDLHLAEAKRHWVIVRTVDLKDVVWC